MLLAGAFIIALVMPAPAHAGSGVALDLGAVDVDQALVPGGRYRLPTIGVRNPGTSASSYVMTVSVPEGLTSAGLEDDWFAFTPSTFALEPGDTQPVEVSLELPPGARAARYEGLLVAQVTSPDGKGVQIGAAAGTRLTFTVRPANWLQGFLQWLWALLVGGAPWTYLLPALLGMLAGARFFKRRFSFRLERRV
jgi:hypothetical protein